MSIIPAPHCHAPSPEAIVPVVVNSLDNDKADDVVVIDLAGRTSIADYMVVASGASSRQIVSMAEHLLAKLAAAGLKGVSAEGIEHGDWVLLDAGDVIVHLFRPEIRLFYALERLWGGLDHKVLPGDEPRVGSVEPLLGGNA